MCSHCDNDWCDLCRKRDLLRYDSKLKKDICGDCMMAQIQKRKELTQTKTLWEGIYNDSKFVYKLIVGFDSDGNVEFSAWKRVFDQATGHMDWHYAGVAEVDNLVYMYLGNLFKEGKLEDYRDGNK